MKKVMYWIATGLTVLVLFGTGAGNIAQSPDAMAGLLHLGYPAYVGTLIGVWHLLGAVGIAISGFPRVREWAYAGVFFDLTGAAFSHLSSRDTAGHVMFPLIVLAVAMASYALAPARAASTSQTAEMESP